MEGFKKTFQTSKAGIKRAHRGTSKLNNILDRDLVGVSIVKKLFGSVQHLLLGSDTSQLNWRLWHRRK
jgi:hypothetical protein